MSEKVEKAEKATRLKVEATRLGYYNLRRVREGEKFAIDAGEFSAAWMVPAGAVPTEFAEEVERKTRAFESRPSTAELRQKADALAASSIRTAVAEGVAQGLSLAEQRRQHEELRRSAGSPAAPGAADSVGSEKDDGSKKPQK